MEKNEEIREIKQKVLLCGFVFLFVLVLGLLFIFNRFGNDVDEVTSLLNDKGSFVVLFTDDKKEDTSSMIEKRLNSFGISYYNFDIHSSSYSNVLEKLDIDYEVVVPALYVIEEGKVLYNITDIQDEDTVNSFINQNNLVDFSNKNS